MPRTYRFDCGCEFPILEGVSTKGSIPALDFNIDTIPKTCPATWALLGRGETKGVFQLESSLGKSWTKKLKPESMEHIGALGALLRPGCISGDAVIHTTLCKRNGRRANAKRLTMRELFEKFNRNHVLFEKRIASVDEGSLQLFDNQIEDVTLSGDKEVFEVKVAVGRRARNYEYGGFCNLECTEDHKLLSHDRGWVELRDLEPGERIAVLRSTKRFHPRTDATPGAKSFRSENLCFMCPNHHRMYSEGTISREMTVAAREKYKLRNSEQVQWVEYTERISLGVKDTYDIAVSGPNHNFIAGNVIVHNCLRAVDSDGVSMTQHYCRRKNGEEPEARYHPAIDKILGPTYGVLTYQEQSMAIAQAVAGFSLQEADVLRKSIGKKDAESMSSCKTLFMDGAKKAGLLTDEQATEVFGWIQKSQRYAFNKSHAMSYGFIGYRCAYIKAHFSLIFFEKWQQLSNDKEEVYELVQDAKLFDVVVQPPNLMLRNAEFTNDGKAVQFGISNIAGIGPAVIKNLFENIDLAEAALVKPLEDFNWVDFLCFLAGKGKAPSDVVRSLIRTGALRWLSAGLSRRRMEYEFDSWSEITDSTRKWAIENRSLLGQTVSGAIQVMAKTKKNGGGCHSQPIADKLMAQVCLLDNPPSCLDDTPHWIAWAEKELLGIALSCSELDSCDLSQVNVSCKEYLAGRTGFLMFGVKLENVRELKTKKGKNPGQLMAFLSISDHTCALEDVVVFPDAWKEYKAHLVQGALVIIQGKRDEKAGTLIVEKVWPAT